MAEDSTFSLKRLLLGKPIPSHLAHHERFPPPAGSSLVGHADQIERKVNFPFAFLGSVSVSCRSA